MHERARPSQFRGLKRLAVAAPLLFLALLEVVRRSVAPDVVETWPSYLIMAGVVLLGTLLFAEAIFRVIGSMQDRLSQQNRELLALHEAGLEIISDLDLHAVLQTVVDEARHLVGARYGALLVLDESGGARSFLVSGISAEVCSQMGPIPVEHGLAGLVLTNRKALRVDDLTLDPRSSGMPEGHTPMRSLIAVPIATSRTVLGNLFLTEKAAAAAFSAEDEATLTRFATQAALAIENARLHQQVQILATTTERERIAREMHDSLAQVLGYVNTKAQAVQTLLRRGENERASVQLGQLADAARAAYADVREGILGLRSSLSADRTFTESLRDYVDHWQDQSNVPVDLVVSSQESLERDLDPFAEVQLLRIIQEALTNIRKHARATRATVRIERSGNWIEAEIVDDGHGFAPDERRTGGVPRFGLSTMRERAEAVGGTFSLDATPSRGTVVLVRLPIASGRPVMER